MEILGWIIWAFVAFLAVTFPIGIYRKLKSGQGVQKATIYQTFGLILATILFLFNDWNKLHMLWIVALLMVLMSLLAFNSGWQKGMTTPEQDNHPKS